MRQICACEAKEDCHAACVNAGSCDAVLGKDAAGAQKIAKCKADCDSKKWDTGTAKPDGGPPPKQDKDTCKPKCDGKQCGDDGCGGSCGNCPSGNTCNAMSQCVPSCQPQCAGKQCGDNGCGGSCGSCPAGDKCDAGKCVPNCQPQCAGKQCGDNGCGGSCGNCPSGDKCDSAGKCAPVGCGGVSYEGCCDGTTLKYCATGNTVKTIDCSKNPSCGWSSSGNIYDCGTYGGNDPSGKHAKNCP